MLNEDQLEIWQDGFEEGYDEGAQDYMESSDDDDDESLWDRFLDWVG